MYILYDDDFTMTYKLDDDNAACTATDSDGHKLQTSFLHPVSVVSRTYGICMKGENKTVQNVVPAGVNVSSYTAEVITLTVAIESVPEHINDCKRCQVVRQSSVPCLGPKPSDIKVSLQMLCRFTERVLISAWVSPRERGCVSF